MKIPKILKKPPPNQNAVDFFIFIFLLFGCWKYCFGEDGSFGKICLDFGRCSADVLFGKSYFLGWNY